MGLARHATRLPLTAISLGLEAWERSRGLREFALRRGNEALQIAAHTPLGRLLPTQVLDDGADEEAARITAAVREQAPTPVAQPPAPKPQAAKPAKPAQAAAPKPQAAAPKPQAAKPTPAETPAPEVPEAAKEVGAPGAVTAEVEQIVEQLEVQEPETRDELPIPDFDNISLGSLRARLRSLNVEQLVTLREWEQAHAHRLPVMTALDNRIAKLGTTTGADAYPAENTAGRTLPA